MLTEFLFIPFEPAISVSDPTISATKALAALVSDKEKSGWEYVHLDNHSTVVPGSNGCFGFGATSPYPKTISIAVFKK
jgi:hypothetical protein